jgi:hypothetical protein
VHLRTGPKRAGQGRESKAAEEEVDPTATPRKRKGESPSATGRGEKKRKTSPEASDVKAEKVAKDAESEAFKDAAAGKEKAAKDAEAGTKEKAAKEKAKVKKDAKATTAAGVPRRDAKDGQALVLTQSPAVEEVVNIEVAVNEPAAYAVSSGDFEELHRQLMHVKCIHKLCSLLI